ncbi:MAG: hypothetical protein HW421_770 [Ignavibacteria bacterium]|nr:hypothetical protein [Ignavibacteria bacterium]
MKNLRILLVIIIATLLSCQNNDPLSPDTFPEIVKTRYSLQGTVWKWEKYKDEKGKIIFVEDSNKRPFILDFVNDSSIKGLSGCNDFGCGYSMNKDSIIIQDGLTTEVNCSLTGLFFSSLSGKSIFAANDNEMLLKTNHPECKEMYFTRNTSNPKFHRNEIKDIDVNGDGIVDFSFNYIDYYDTNNINLINEGLSVHATNKGNYFTPSFQFKKLNDTIGNNIKYFDKVIQQISECCKYYFGWYDYWFPSYTKKYMPIKVKLSDGEHLGWICISVSRRTGDLTIHDYTLNKIANMPIIAGKK